MNTRLLELSDYKTGEILGEVQVTDIEYFWIDLTAQEPEGIFRADELAPEEWSKLDLKADQTVFFSRNWEESESVASASGSADYSTHKQ